MKWATISLGLLAAVASTGCNCWRPAYYGNTYAQPAYTQAPAFQPPAPVYSQPQPVYAQPQVVQSAPVMQQTPMAQGCQPVYCQPCTPCY